MPRILVIGIAAAFGLSLASCGTSAPAASLPPTAPSTRAGGGFKALEGKQLPGTSASDWGQFSSAAALSPSTDGEYANSNDLTYAVAFFNFSTAAAAASFYNSPPPAIQGFVAGALGYTTLTGSTGVPAPARGLDLQSCSGESPRQNPLLPSGRCQDGSSPFSVGVGTIIQRGTTVAFVAYLSGTTLISKANPADLSKIAPYCLDALRLLSGVGL